MKQTLCFHCNLPVPADFDASVVIDGQQQPMCCPGCQAAASAIVEGGLAKFYHYRFGTQQLPNISDRNDSDAFSAYDLPGVQEEFVYNVDADTEGTASGLSGAELLVEGITCAACAWLIEHHLGRIPGVQTVAVNVTNHRCRIEWDSQKVALSRLLRELTRIGYRCRPASDDAVREQRARENRRALQRLGVAGIGMMQAGLLAVALYAGAFDDMELQWRQFLRWVSLLVATPVVLFSAAPFFAAAWRSLKSGHLVMDVPVSLAIGLAYSASAWATISGAGEVYFDSVSMFTFFLLSGRYLEMRVRHRNELQMEGLGQLLPPVATRVDRGQPGKQASEVQVPVKALRAGNLVRVAQGEVIPCDGTVRDGTSHVIEAVLTGEQNPIGKSPGSKLSAGTVNTENPLLIEVSAVGSDTRLSAILRLVERAQMEKPRQVVMADRLAAYFVGLVLLLATGVYLFWWQIEPSRALWVTLSVLVVTCPCALSLATPAALAVATRQIRQLGLLVGRGHVLDALRQADRVVFDKTGTLTTGHMAIARVFGYGEVSESKVLAIAAALEVDSRHPIARAFIDCGAEQCLTATDVDNRTGAGVTGVIDGVRYAVGKSSWINELFGRDAKPPQRLMPGEVWILVASEQALLGWVVLRDQLREDAAATVAGLGELGLESEVLSGDHPEAARAIAAQAGIDRWQGGVSPEQKLNHIRSLQAQGHRVVMVGDGINDVPVLSGANVSVAMGNAADIARIHADSILISGHLQTLVDAVRFARRTETVIRQNLAWALIYNALALPLAAMGHVPPWVAAIGMSASSLAVVLNALRLRRNSRRSAFGSRSRLAWN